MAVKDTVQHPVVTPLAHVLYEMQLKVVTKHYAMIKYSGTVLH